VDVVTHGSELPTAKSLGWGPIASEDGYSGENQPPQQAWYSAKPNLVFRRSLLSASVWRGTRWTFLSTEGLLGVPAAAARLNAHRSGRPPRFRVGRGNGWRRQGAPNSPRAVGFGLEGQRGTQAAGAHGELGLEARALAQAYGLGASCARHGRRAAVAPASVTRRSPTLQPCRPSVWCLRRHDVDAHKYGVPLSAPAAVSRENATCS
jgi:hypothetical protein